jgi:hypothetical protein
LIDRKAELRRLLASRSLRAQKASRVCYVDYIERTGSAVFELICQRDLEGVVAKFQARQLRQRTRTQRLDQGKEQELFAGGGSGGVLRRKEAGAICSWWLGFLLTRL